jgi:endonuclease-3 related protein
MKRRSVLKRAYELLWNRYGPQGWWPGDSTLEIMIGAVLTQNTNWKNVQLSIARLRDAAALDFDSLLRMPQPELEELIRPAGYFRVKARRLRNLLSCIDEDCRGDLAVFLDRPPDLLRELLLSVNGIGPETADSIVLYAARQPIFVVDAYTARILKRHSWIDVEADYSQLQEFFHDELPRDEKLFNEFHALMVRTGKEYCRPTPRCEGCPLESLLPPNGPAEDYRGCQ